MGCHGESRCQRELLSPDFQHRVFATFVYKPRTLLGDDRVQPVFGQSWQFPFALFGVAVLVLVVKFHEDYSWQFGQDAHAGFKS